MYDQLYTGGRPSLSALQAALTRLAERNADLRAQIDLINYELPEYTDVSSLEITVALVARALEDRWRRGVLFSDFWSDFTGTQDATTAWNTAVAVTAAHPSRKLLLPSGSIKLSPGITLPGISIESVVSRSSSNNRSKITFSTGGAINCIELEGKVSIRGIDITNTDSPYVFRDTTGQCDRFDLRDSTIISINKVIKLDSTPNVTLRQVTMSYSINGSFVIDISGADVDFRNLFVAGYIDSMKLTSCSGRISAYSSEVAIGLYGSLFLVTCADLAIGEIDCICYYDVVSAININQCRRVRFRNAKLSNFYEDPEYEIVCSVPCIYWYNSNEIEFESIYAQSMTGSEWYSPEGNNGIQGQYFKFGGFAYTATGGLQYLSAAPHGPANNIRLIYDEITSKTTYDREPDNNWIHKFGKWEVIWSSNPAVGRPMCWVREKETIWTTLESPPYPA